MTSFCMTDIEYLEKYYQGPIEKALKKLEKGIPVQYIVGSVDFLGYPILVNPNVLIPRFETEELVEKTIIRCQKKFLKKIEIAEIGTGSGCISIALKKKFPDSFVEAVDISSKALEVAIQNAKANDVEIHFVQGNLLEPLTKKYDLLISNPPYIDPEEEIMEIVKKNEPSIALFAPNHGLFYYEEIFKNAHKVMKKNCLLAFEIGAMQGDLLKSLACTYFPDGIITVEKDLQGRDRFLFIEKNL